MVFHWLATNGNCFHLHCFISWIDFLCGIGITFREVFSRVSKKVEENLIDTDTYVFALNIAKGECEQEQKY